MTVNQQNEIDLENLYTNYLGLYKQYSYEDWRWGDVPVAHKSQTTKAYRKFFRFAESLGYDMITTVPKVISANV